MEQQQGGTSETFTSMGREMGESPRDKFFRKMREQPLVPIGSLLTCGALIVASNHLRTGNRDSFNKALRWRVGFQGLTVLAALLGSLYYQQTTQLTTTPKTSTWQQSRANERAQKQKDDFNSRLLHAQNESYDDKKLEDSLLGKEILDDLNPSNPNPPINQDTKRQV